MVPNYSYFVCGGNEYRILKKGIKNCVCIATGRVVQSEVCILKFVHAKSSNEK